MTLVKGLSFLKGTDSNSLSLYFVYNCQLNCYVQTKYRESEPSKTNKDLRSESAVKIYW